MKKLILLFVLVSLIVGCGEDKNPGAKKLSTYDKIQLEAQWSEARTAVGMIKAMMDVYAARMSGDLTELNLTEGFVPGSSLLVALKADDDTFTSLQYFDAEDFSVELLDDGVGANYLIHVDASKGATGGTSGKGPKTGKGTFNSSTGKWTGMLK